MAASPPLRVFWACVGYSERLVAETSERAALRAMGLKHSERDRVRFHEISEGDDRPAFIRATRTPGVLLRRLAGSGDAWRES